MAKTLLAVGNWQQCSKLVASALSNGLSILHTDRVDDVKTALQTRLDLILLSGGAMRPHWERVTGQAWSVNTDVPVLILSADGSQDAVLDALLGTTFRVRYPAMQASLPGRGDTLLAEGRCCPIRHTHLTPTLSLYEPTANRVSGEIRSVLDHVEHHYADPITLAEVASLASYSRCHFCKVFKTQMQISFVDYLSRVRIRHAARLLTGSEMQVTQIAYEVGFNDLSHFEKVFRAILGQSPSHFRQQAKHLPQA